MAKIKKVGRPSIWPKGSQKPLNIGMMPACLHADIKQYAKRKKSELLQNIHRTAKQAIKKEVANG